MMTGDAFAFDPVKHMNNSNNTTDSSNFRTLPSGTNTTTTTTSSLSLIDMVTTGNSHSGTPLGSRTTSYLHHCNDRSPLGSSSTSALLSNSIPSTTTTRFGSTTLKIDQDRTSANSFKSTSTPVASATNKSLNGYQHKQNTHELTHSHTHNNDDIVQFDDRSIVFSVSGRTVSSEANGTITSTRSALSAPPTPWNGRGQRQDVKHWTDDKTIVSDSCLLAEEEATQASEGASIDVVKDLHNAVVLTSSSSVAGGSVLSEVGSRGSVGRSSTGPLPGISEQPWMQYLETGGATSKGSATAPPQDISASIRRVALKQQHGALHSLLEEQRSLREPGGGNVELHHSSISSSAASSSSSSSIPSLRNNNNIKKGKERRVLPDILDLSPVEETLTMNGVSGEQKKTLNELFRCTDEANDRKEKIRK